MEWIEQRISETSGNLAQEYRTLGELFEKKLWHELTLRIEHFIMSAGEEAAHLLGLVERFLPKFEQRINQLKYAQILCGILNRCAASGAMSPDNAISHLEETVHKKRSRLGPEASVYVDMEATCLRLKYFASELKRIKERLDEAQPTIDALVGTTDTAVFHKYYSARAAYYKMAGPPEEFYRAALSLLSYASEDEFSPESKYELATDMSLAALSGEGVYNFGEVLATPILSALDNTPNAWLGEMLKIFGRGDVDAFAALVSSHRAHFDAQPALVARFDFLKEKIALLALMNLLFETPSHSRTIPFEVIAQRASLQLDQVEWLAMRAMALGLIMGQIDQVNTTIQITWLAPKVLDQDQIKHLISQLDTLSGKATNALSIIHDQTADLL